MFKTCPNVKNDKFCLVKCGEGKKKNNKFNKKIIIYKNKAPTITAMYAHHAQATMQNVAAVVLPNASLYFFFTN